jgi:hypothetical protein
MEQAMRAPKTVRSAEALGRVRLSRSFFMRDFLYSEIANVHRMTNLPDDPDFAIAAGRRLCEDLLEPLQATAYHSPAVNAYGNVHDHNCASNARNHARHIWDRRDVRGMGAVACIAVPWLVDRMQAGTPWQAMAWWIHDHLPLQRAAVLPEALCLQYRLARGAQAHDLQFHRAARIPDQARLPEPRRQSRPSLRRIPQSGRTRPC